MSDTSSAEDTTEVMYNGSPSLRPTVAAAVTVGVITIILVVALFFTGDTLVGDTSESLAGVIGVLGSLVVLRYVGRMYVLRRTKYVVTRREVRRERKLLFSHSTREIPVSRIRGVEMTQTPLQRLLGYGSVSVLTAGPNQSLGFVSLSQVPEPRDRREELRTVMSVPGNQNDSAVN